MTANQVALWYLVASVFFILALKGLSSPTTSRRGNLFGMIGMPLFVFLMISINSGLISSLMYGNNSLTRAASTPFCSIWKMNFSTSACVEARPT